MEEPGASVCFPLPPGAHLGLVMVEHAWSGTILVELGRTKYRVDLYSPEQRQRVFEVPLPLLARTTTATIRLLPERHPDSAAHQAWIYGAYITADPTRSAVVARARRLARRVLDHPWLAPRRPLPFSPPSPSSPPGTPAPPETSVPAGAPPWSPDKAKVVPVGERLVFVRGVEADYLTLTNDVGISQEIRQTGVWAGRDVGLFKELIKPGMFVLDIGANIGHHTVLFSRLVGDEGKVLAVEPQRVMFSLLETNVFLNGCSNVDSFRVALGETPGEVTMWPADYSAPTNFGAVGVFDNRAAWSPAQQGEIVTLSTVDHLVRRYGPDRRVDFLKIDVQAYELPCLRGALELLRRDHPVIFLEISPHWMKQLVGYDYREIFQLLAELGYLLYEPHRSRTTPSEREWSGEELEEWDILAIPTAQ